MNLKKSKVTGSSLLMLIGVVCMATIFVSAAVLILSLPKTNGSEEVGIYPVNITMSNSATYHDQYTTTTGMEAWTYAAAVPGNHYGEEFTAAYTGESHPNYDIRVTVTSDIAYVGSDIVIGYIENNNAPGIYTPDAGATYNNLVIPDGTQTDSIWTSSVVIHSSASTALYYWMQITPYHESAHFTVTYQAIQAVA
jgi:heme/copper-type cytochrome/quinol oxidase subunit 2